MDCTLCLTIVQFFYIDMKLSEELQKINNMSVKEMADKCGIAYETFRFIYYGRTVNPRLDTVIQICKCLNIKSYVLFDDLSKEECSLLNNYKHCDEHGKKCILNTANTQSLINKLSKIKEH